MLPCFYDMLFIGLVLSFSPAIVFSLDRMDVLPGHWDTLTLSLGLSLLGMILASISQWGSLLRSALAFIVTGVLAALQIYLIMALIAAEAF